jgi:hypothetical protein
LFAFSLSYFVGKPESYLWYLIIFFLKKISFTSGTEWWRTREERKNSGAVVEEPKFANTTAKVEEGRIGNPSSNLKAEESSTNNAPTYSESTTVTKKAPPPPPKKVAPPPPLKKTESTESKRPLPAPSDSKRPLPQTRPLPESKRPLPRSPYEDQQ